MRKLVQGEWVDQEVQTSQKHTWWQLGRVLCEAYVLAHRQAAGVRKVRAR